MRSATGRISRPVNRRRSGSRSGDSRRQSFGELVLVGRWREAIRRLNPAIPSRALATLRDTLLPKLLSGELSVADAVLADGL